jgi:hypothetical protein
MMLACQVGKSEVRENLCDQLATPQERIALWYTEAVMAAVP